jgi:8-oxo-dGTP pyrophosphatase MutT (NUDIX family)
LVSHFLPDKIEFKEDVIRKADIIFCATWNFSLQNLDFLKLKNWVILSSVTSSDDELDIKYLDTNYSKEVLNKYTTKYYNDKNYIYLLNWWNDKKKVAIIHNINLDKWLVPGWHWEKNDKEFYNSAKREAIEETGLKGLELFSWHAENNFIPIDIDTHYIPENSKKQEKEHFHHDFRYIFILKDKDENIKLQLDEVKWFMWKMLDKNIENFSWNKVLGKIRVILNK